MNKAYSEGKASFIKNNGALRNPYSPGTEEHSLFERGWQQALRQSPQSHFKSGEYIFSETSAKALAEKKAEEAMRKEEEAKRKEEFKRKYLAAKGR